MNRILLAVGVLVGLAPTCLAQAPQEISAAMQPHAGSQQEATDYHAHYLATGGRGAEDAANSFAKKYPQSELRSYLFARAMTEYQRENNSAGILQMGERVLTLNPNHTLALVLTATVLADGLTPSDPERDRKTAEIAKNATRAIQTVNTSFVPPAAVSPAQATIYKTTLQAMAYSALGVMKLKTGDYPEAEKDLKMAADLQKVQPDASVWYHLALAQDHRRKYRAALNSVEQALQLSSSNPELQQLAETEYQRLTGRAKEPSDSGGSQPPE